MKKIISYILTIFLIICLISITLLQIVSNTVFKKEYVLRKLEDCNFYNTFSFEIEDTFKNYILQSGLSEEVVTNIITPEYLESIMEEMINRLYNGDEFKIDSSYLKQKLEDNISEYLEKNNLRVNSTDDNSIKGFIDVLVQQYEKKLTNNLGIKYLSKSFNICNRYYNKALIILLSCILFIILLIYFTNKNFSYVLNYLIISIISISLFLIGTFIYIKININIDEINIFSQSISDFIQFFMKDIMNKIKYICLFCLAFGTISSIFINLKSKK